MKFHKYCIVLIFFYSCQSLGINNDDNTTFNHNDVCYQIISSDNQFLEISTCSKQLVSDKLYKSAAREFLKKDDKACSVMNYIENSETQFNKILMIRCP